MNQRIVLVVTTFPKISEIFVVHKLSGLLRAGWDVHVVCKQSDESEWNLLPDIPNKKELQSRVHVQWPHIPRWKEAAFFPFVFFLCAIQNPIVVLRYLLQGARQFGWRTLNNLYLDAAFITLKPSVIHFEFADLAKGRTHLKRFLKCRIFSSFRGHELNFVGLHQPNFYEEVWHESDEVVFVSKDLLQRAYMRGFSDSCEHIIILGSVDTNYFQPNKREIVDVIGTQDRPARILSIGRLSWSKGYEYGLQALALLNRKGISFEYRIIGDGLYRDAILFALHDLGIESSVKLLSWQSPRQVKEHMAWADIFLHSSVSEGFGLVVLEAQAMSLPVVCSDADGLPENISDGQSGFVVPRRNPEAIAQKLWKLIQDSSLRTEMGEAGRRRALTCFAVDAEISAYDQLLRRTLSRKDSPTELSSTKSTPLART